MAAACTQAVAIFQLAQRGLLDVDGSVAQVRRLLVRILLDY